MPLNENKNFKLIFIINHLYLLPDPLVKLISVNRGHIRVRMTKLGELACNPRVRETVDWCMLSNTQLVLCLACCIVLA